MFMAKKLKIPKLRAGCRKDFVIDQGTAEKWNRIVKRLGVTQTHLFESVIDWVAGLPDNEQRNIVRH